jgi:hypothetical protein
MGYPVNHRVHVMRRDECIHSQQVRARSGENTLRDHIGDVATANPDAA